MTCTAPECCQAKLGVCIHGRAFQQAFLWMEKLTNERVVQPGLPLLDEGKLQTPKVVATGKKRDWGPDEQVLMFTPVA